jgi:hypothetical protein
MNGAREMLSLLAFDLASILGMVSSEAAEWGEGVMWRLWRCQSIMHHASGPVNSPILLGKVAVVLDGIPPLRSDPCGPREG